MANYEIRFMCSSGDETYITSKLNKDLSTDSITIATHSPAGNIEFIYLDKSTAIKFAKTLRTEINKLTESEVANG